MPINQIPDLHEIVICSNMFVRKDNKYLLLKRSPLKKYLPNYVHPIGGKINLGEDPLTGARRELLEESGLEVKNVRLEATIMEIEPHPTEPYNWLIFHFSGDYATGEIKPTEEGELIWLTRDEILKEKLFPSLQQVIHKILNPSQGTVFATFHYDTNKEYIVEDNKIIDSCTV